MNPFTSIFDFFAGTREVWLRIGIGSAGVSLIIIGLVIILVSNKDVQKVAGGVTSAVASKTPVGAAVAVGAGALT